MKIATQRALADGGLRFFKILRFLDFFFKITCVATDLFFYEIFSDI